MRLEAHRVYQRVQLLGSWAQFVVTHARETGRQMIEFGQRFRVDC